MKNATPVCEDPTVDQAETSVVGNELARSAWIGTHADMSFNRLGQCSASRFVYLRSTYRQRAANVLLKGTVKSIAPSFKRNPFRDTNDRFSGRNN
jgi:hypothetical protein